MKHFLIRYSFKEGRAEDWHRDIAGFIAALEDDPELRGKISYRAMKIRDGADYMHIAAAADEQAIKALQSRDFFTRYNDRTKQVAGGHVEVVPLDIIGSTTTFD